MKRKSILALQMTAVALQTVALLVTLGFTAIQSAVKSIFSVDGAVLEHFSIPVNCFVEILPLLLVYVVGWLLLSKTSGKSRNTSAAILLGCAVFLQVVLQYTDMVTSYIVGRYGAVALASHAVLERAICLIANPLTWIALALFCFSCGGCFGVEEHN